MKREIYKWSHENQNISQTQPKNQKPRHSGLHGLIFRRLLQAQNKM